jgi:hypothetical protein
MSDNFDSPLEVGFCGAAPEPANAAKPRPTVAFMPSDDWLEETLDLLDERDRAKERKSSEGL